MTRFARLALASTALLCTALPASFSSAQSGGAQPAPYTVAETGRSYTRLQDAVDAIGNGRGTIRFASLRFADCAVQTGGDVTYEAAVPGQSVLDGTICEGKGALVLRGHSARVEGLVFANMHAPERNGVGIRLEHGDLAISQSWFRDSDQGILTANDPAGTITIDKSTFTRLGTCDGPGCAHSIYIGDYGALTVTRSRFEAGTGGHYAKSRAARVAILNCSFDDTHGRGTNYMIDLPEGATGRIAGNWFVQGRDKENYSAFIAVAAEHHSHSADGLTIEDNNARFAPGVDRRSAFVADWSGDALKIGANVLGPGLVRFEER
ncbi:right-handed parallel beta-helix repeat-containing protein [Novosphingobium beihaiensis]|uniref:Right-handed parallel beta-helix repeat-containing protein n=1 Tax=Novosphingobium beihaiensis TaxID=2930389 RepID=A0ABT0BSI1_9SPHN|nr:right-handed parallel beta-helix repeat-containing protein [Novosphingobium beihaiensis]MCJ2187991.1 right-handed parallel beta-helix repeat-containing protein [Novosphingobium beihaiensis]